MRRPGQLALTVAGTMAAGILGARLVSHGAAASAPAAEPRERTGASRDVASSAFHTALLATLEARVSALEGEGAPAGAPAQPLPGGPARALHTPEERQKRIAADYAVFEQHLEAHSMSQRDEAWAAKMEASLAKSAQVTTDGAKFKYEGVDCRSSTCTVSFSWPSRAAAETDMRKVLSALASSGCTREIALPPPSGADDAPSKHTVLLTCQP